MRVTASFVVLGALLSACSSTPASPTPTTPVEDAAAALPSCSAEAKLDAPFDLDPSGPDGQIHAYAEPTGDGFFVVYNRPNAAAKSGNFEVYVTKLGCDGRVVVPPTRVSDSTDNEIDPAAVWDGKRLVVVWSADTGKAPTNLELRTRAIGPDGKALGSVTTLALVRKSKPNQGNAWMPAIAASENGSWLAGAWGNDDAPAFQAFAQRLDVNGAPSGEAIDIALDAKVTQSTPAVAVDSSGKRWVAWAQEPNEGNAQAGAWLRGETGAPEEIIAEGGAPSLATGASGTWLAARGAVVEVGSKVRAKLPSTFAQPAIAADATGAVVVAYTGTSGRVPVHAARISKSGEVGSEVDLGISNAAPYPLKLARIADGVFLFAYQEGAGTKIRAKARILAVK